MEIDENKAESTVFGGGLTPSQITQILVSKWKLDPAIKEMKVADKYFSTHNEEIEKKTRVYYDRDRKPIDNPHATNTKIKSNFLRMLVQQKQDYAFAKSFVIKLKSDKEKEVDLSKDDYGKAWKDFVDETLFRFSYTLSGLAVNHGITWAYIWIDEEGKLRLKDVPATFVYPVWKDRQHTELDRLIYDYSVEKYDGTINSTLKEYAEYWSDTERILFDVNNGYKEIPQTADTAGNPIHSHMASGDEGVSWEKIPFIPFKATDDEKPLLSFVKEQIDAYDGIGSRVVDGLADDLDPILVIKGISPDVDDLIEARELARMTRTISLETDGMAEYIQAQTAVDSHLKTKEDLRRDIIKFGYGVDYEDARFGGNPNQLVIKSLYQNMDTYCDGLERHFQDFINDLKYFFDKWYEFTGKGKVEPKKYKVLVELDRSMMINQSAQIEDSVKLAGTGVSRKTQFEFNPVVQDVDLEMERLKEEQKESSENELFNFAQKTNIENGGEFESSADNDVGQNGKQPQGEE